MHTNTQETYTQEQVPPAALLNQPAQPHVLVIDDDPSVLMLYGEVLRDEGIPVHTTACPNDAAKYMQNHHPDVVISDLRMPKVNGYDLLKKLHGLNGTGTQFYLQTGTPNDDLAVKAREEGLVKDVFVKTDISVFDLVSTVQQHYKN